MLNSNTKDTNVSDDLKETSDDINVDEFTFRPINQGLGFHQKREKVLSGFIAPKKNVRQHPQMASPIPGSLTSGTANISNLSNIKLESVYGNSSQKTDKEPEVDVVDKQQKNVSSNRYSEVSRIALVVAWVIDMMMISAICAMIFFASLKVANLNLSHLRQLITLENALYLVALGSFIYIIYFSIWDLVASPGKALLRLKVVSVNDQPPKIHQTFVRAFIGLINVCFFGLVVFFDFHSDFSKTKVVKETK